MATLPKWTDERTDELTNFVGDEVPISQVTVAEAADQLETTTRSVSSKLRKMGFEVELASAKSVRAFSDSQEATLSAFVTDNSGEYTYAEIASHFESGAFSPKSIQGKILSMELTGHVKASTPDIHYDIHNQEEIRGYADQVAETFVFTQKENT